MGKVVSWRPKPDRAANTARVGMVFLIATWAMMFASLFFSYAFVRAGADVWPPADTPRLPIWRAAAATVAMALLVVLVEVGRRGIRVGKVRSLVWSWGGALGLLLAFAALVVSAIIEGKRLRAGGSFGSLSLTMLFFHVVFVVTAAPSLGMIATRAAKGAYSAARHVGVRLWSVFWYVAAGIWLLMFLLLYVV